MCTICRAEICVIFLQLYLKIYTHKTPSLYSYILLHNFNNNIQHNTAPQHSSFTPKTIEQSNKKSIFGTIKSAFLTNNNVYNSVVTNSATSLSAATLEAPSGSDATSSLGETVEEYVQYLYAGGQRGHDQKVVVDWADEAEGLAHRN